MLVTVKIYSQNQFSKYFLYLGMWQERVIFEYNKKITNICLFETNAQITDQTTLKYKFSFKAKCHLAKKYSLKVFKFELLG